MTSLLQLNVEDNRIRGNFPTTMGQMSDLTNIFLKSNRMTGQVPSEVEGMISLSE